MDIRFYPCTKSGKLIKGFCLCVCDNYVDVVKTLSQWKRFANQFGLHYYAISENGSDYQVRKL